MTVLALGVLVVASWPQPVVPAVPAADVQLDGATGPAGPVESEVAEPPVGDDSLADQEPAPADRGPAGSVPAPVAGSAGVEVVVHVVGQVARPGLVGLPAGARVADAVEAAGGASDGADLAALNLARTVTDGEQVYVPAPGEEVPAPPPTRSAGGGAAEEPTAPVRVNEADASTLATLPGIGPVLAERIVARRDENGPFTQVDQLAEVSGIGPVLLDELRDLVTV
nr:ComEA family DNA-binding protein [Isoptericola chiayiensis]